MVIHLTYSVFRDQSGNESVHEPTREEPLHSRQSTDKNSDMYSFEDEKKKDRRPRRRKNDIIGMPSDVALLRYVEQVASVEGVRQRFQVIYMISTLVTV